MDGNLTSYTKELEQVRIVYGRQGKEFALLIADELKKKEGLQDFQITDVELTEFADGEIKPRILGSVRGKDVYVVQRFHEKPFGINEDLWELYLLNDALIRESARSITNVLPYLPYCRQDKRVINGEPISSKVMISFLEHQKINRIITMDLHSAAIQAFANFPIDNLYARPLLANIVEKEFNKDAILVSPDLGGSSRVEEYARMLGKEFVTVRKKRSVENRDLVEMREIEGIEDLKGKNAIIIDDMVDTAGTIEKCCEVLKARGVKEIFVLCTHAILSGDAVNKLRKNDCRLIATDAIPLIKDIDKSIRIESAAKYFADAIYKIQIGEPLN